MLPVAQNSLTQPRVATEWLPAAALAASRGVGTAAATRPRHGSLLAEPARPTQILAGQHECAAPAAPTHVGGQRT
eukprot:scaffold262_cov103-Isochrysis_galbana.AAC.10